MLVLTMAGDVVLWCLWGLTATISAQMQYLGQAYWPWPAVIVGAAMVGLFLHWFLKTP